MGEEVQHQQPAVDAVTAKKTRKSSTKPKMTPAQRQAAWWFRAHAATVEAQAAESAIWNKMDSEARTLIVERLVNERINGEGGWWLNQ